MVKKALNKLKIDFENGIIENSLLQIRRVENLNELELLKVWVVTIKPQDSSKFLTILKESLIADDPTTLTHIKRINKVGSALKLVLCSEGFVTQGQLQQILSGTDYTNLEVLAIPRQIPLLKELAVQWSKEYWPLLWKGNPNDQILNEVKVNMDQIKKYLTLISNESTHKQQQDDGCLPIITAIVDPQTDTLLSLSGDSRSDHPLNHSVMNAITKISQMEQARRRTLESKQDHKYLCYGYHVYTTHEPCSMCSMALIHSRIDRLIYLRQMSKTGGLNPNSGDGYCIHDHKLLNSKFEVWGWVGDVLRVGDVADCINA